jgi:hypothetical protein
MWGISPALHMWETFPRLPAHIQSITYKREGVEEFCSLPKVDGGWVGEQGRE